MSPASIDDEKVNDWFFFLGHKMKRNYWILQLANPWFHCFCGFFSRLASPRFIMSLRSHEVSSFNQLLTLWKKVSYWSCFFCFGWFSINSPFQHIRNWCSTDPFLNVISITGFMTVKIYKHRLHPGSNYDPVHNIREFYQALVLFPFTTSKTELDI